MTQISKKPRNNKIGAPVWLLSVLVLMTLVFVIWQVLVLEGLVVSIPPPSDLASSLRVGNPKHFFSGTTKYEEEIRSKRVNREHRPQIVAALFDERQWEKRIKTNEMFLNVQENPCGYNKGFLDLSDEELHPRAGKRHMITPPAGGKLSLVCCETTVGNLVMNVHHNWAPIGAAHFVAMVKDGYFDSTVPFMRCIKNFLCQFGINSDPTKNKKFNKNLKDDPNWLPEGPDHRENIHGVKRFAKGYLAYAGAGPNTRGNQLIMSLKADGPLAGGSPWEVPFGELVGKESFETLSKIYTGYGEDGPPQGKLSDRGMDEEYKKEFSKIDYINKCMIVAEVGNISAEIEHEEEGSHTLPSTDA